MSTALNNVKTKKRDDASDVKMYGVLPEGSKLEFFPKKEMSVIGTLTIISASELAKAVSDFYRETFHDLSGVYIGERNDVDTFSKIKNSGYVNIVPEVQFIFENKLTPVTDGKIKNLVDSTSVFKTSSTFDKQSAINNRAVGKGFQLNKETRLLLGDIMREKDKSSPNNNIFWESVTSQRTAPDMIHGTGVRVYTIVTGIDINKLCSKIFGNKFVVSTQAVANSDGTVSDKNKYANAMYRTTVVGKTVDPGLNKWVSQLKIERINSAYIDEKINEINAANNVYMPYQWMV